MKVCPLMSGVVTYSGGFPMPGGGEAELKLVECIGNKCMAYEVGHCKALGEVEIKEDKE